LFLPLRKKEYLSIQFHTGLLLPHNINILVKSSKEKEKKNRASDFYTVCLQSLGKDLERLWRVGKYREGFRVGGALFISNQESCVFVGVMECVSMGLEKKK
jgi:hypothetical protein